MQGLDITEAFEVHHMDIDSARKILENYKIRDAAKPRNFKFTFNETDFYRTFRRRIYEKLKTINRKPETMSKVILTNTKKNILPNLTTYFFFHVF